MKYQIKYFLVGLTIILLSTPLGYKTVNTVYYNRNLAGEYIPMLNGFIHSFIIIGILIFVFGLVDVLVNKK